MRMFFICQRVPFPPDRGDKITTFNEIRHLSAKHEVHVFCLADGKPDARLTLVGRGARVAGIPWAACVPPGSRSRRGRVGSAFCAPRAAV